MGDYETWDEPNGEAMHYWPGGKRLENEATGGHALYCQVRRFLGEVRLTKPSPYHWTQYAERERYALWARAKWNEVAARCREGK